jgi:hypothetical protein
MFSDYFLYGLTAFGSHVLGSTAASDVNGDGATLTVADLQYLFRVSRRDTLPFPQRPVTGVVASFTQPGMSYAVVDFACPDTLGSIYLVFEGCGTPELEQAGLTLRYACDGTNTHVLITQASGAAPIKGITPGHVLTIGNPTLYNRLISAEASTVDGAVVSIVVSDVTDVPGDKGSLPSVFALHQNYPNPFNGGTVVAFDLPRASEVQFDVLNLLGQVVYSVREHYAAGSHQIRWDGTADGRSAASGVYYYRLKAGAVSDTKKMLLLK